MVREAAYGNVEHEHVVEDQVRQEDAGDEGLGQLEPRYAELRQAVEKGEVDEDPLQKEPPRRVAIFDDLQPVVELPRPQEDVDAKCVETLLGRVEEGEGDDGLAGDILRRLVLGREGQSGRLGRGAGGGRGDGGHGRWRLLLKGLTARSSGRWGRWEPRPQARR